MNWRYRVNVIVRKYCLKSTIHGLKYLYKTSGCQHVAWATSVILSLAMCSYMVFLLHAAYIQTATVTSIEANTYPVNNVPFPSVSICNANKVSKTDYKIVRKILEEEGVPNEDIENFGKVLNDISPLQPAWIRVANSNDALFEVINKKLKFSVLDLMAYTAQNCSQLIKMCTFNDVADCMEHFTLTRTAYGFCCVFNYRASDRFLNSELNDDEPAEKSANAGFFSGLNVVLELESWDYINPKMIVSAKIIIGDPYDYIDSNTPSVTIGINRSASIKVLPLYSDGNRSIRRLHWSERMCYFYDEVNLDITDRYSFSSCITECRIKKIYELCGCVPYYYPTKRAKYRECTLIDIECQQKNAPAYTGLQFLGINKDSNCTCLPECSETKYFIKSNTDSVEILEIDFYKRYIANHTDRATLFVYYESPRCTKYTTKVVLEWFDLLSGYGQIISLGFGMSILSLVELLIDCIFKIVDITIIKIQRRAK